MWSKVHLLLLILAVVLEGLSRSEDQTLLWMKNGGKEVYTFSKFDVRVNKLKDDMGKMTQEFDNISQLEQELMTGKVNLESIDPKNQIQKKGSRYTGTLTRKSRPRRRRLRVPSSNRRADLDFFGNESANDDEPIHTGYYYSKYKRKNGLPKRRIKRPELSSSSRSSGYDAPRPHPIRHRPRKSSLLAKSLPFLNALLSLGSLLSIGLAALALSGLNQARDAITFNPTITNQGDNITLTVTDSNTVTNTDTTSLTATSTNTQSQTVTQNNNNTQTILPILIDAEGNVMIGPIQNGVGKAQKTSWNIGAVATFLFRHGYIIDNIRHFLSW